MTTNRVRLQARIASKQPLRYTPAGVAVLSFAVAHQSRQVEAGQARDLMLEMDCIALGELAQNLQAVPSDSTLELSGFLGNRSSKSRWIVFHVTEFVLKSSGDKDVSSKQETH